MPGLRDATTDGTSLFCEFASLTSDHELCEAPWCACPCHTADQTVAKEMREILTPTPRRADA